VFEFDEKISFDANNEIRSVLEAPIISPNFVHVNDLITFDASYDYRKLPANQAGTRICKITYNISVGGDCGGCAAETGGWCSEVLCLLE